MSDTKKKSGISRWEFFEELMEEVNLLYPDMIASLSDICEDLDRDKEDIYIDGLKDTYGGNHRTIIDEFTRAIGKIHFSSKNIKTLQDLARKEKEVKDKVKHDLEFDGYARFGDNSAKNFYCGLVEKVVRMKKDSLYAEAQGQVE